MFPYHNTPKDLLGLSIMKCIWLISDEKSLGGNLHNWILVLAQWIGDRAEQCKHHWTIWLGHRVLQCTKGGAMRKGGENCCCTGWADIGWEFQGDGCSFWHLKWNTPRIRDQRHSTTNSNPWKSDSLWYLLRAPVE